METEEDPSDLDTQISIEQSFETAPSLFQFTVASKSGDVMEGTTN